MGVADQRHAPADFPPGKDPVPIVQEDGWAPGPVWTAEENLAPTGIRFPDRRARSESLYRLSYPGPHLYVEQLKKQLVLYSFPYVLFHSAHCYSAFGQMCQRSRK